MSTQKSKTVAILQSNYIPWKGYFDIINDVDLFIFYDDVQYTKADWRNRNKIKSAKGAEWITVPVNGTQSMLINQVEMIDSKWQQTHWKTLLHQYGKAPFFKQYKDFFEKVYLGNEWRNLSELNQYLIKLISKEILKIKADFANSSEYLSTGAKQDRLLDILGKCSATAYVSGPAAKSYIEDTYFTDNNINLIWKDYSGYPEYPQFYPPFNHGVTILDLIFHTGPDAPWYIWGWRQNQP